MPFQGFGEEGSPVTLLVLLESNNAPVEPDAAPTYKVYGSNGPVNNGVGSASKMETASITGATNASPIVVTSAGHGLSVGQVVFISGVAGNTGANGTFIVSAVTTDSFTLSGSTGTGAYTSGGTWNTKGLYKITLTGSVLSSLSAGRTYTVQVTWTESASPKSKEISFTVR